MSKTWGNGRGTQCVECKGFGHIKIECHAFLKDLKKELFITWYDFENESEGEDANPMIAYSGKYEPGGEMIS